MAAGERGTCELIRETEQQIRWLQDKQSETTQDSVRRASLCADPLCISIYYPVRMG